MTLILLIFVTVCALAMVIGRRYPNARWLGVGGIVAMVYFISLMIWWYALYFQIVPVYRALAALKIYRTEGVLGGLIFLGPPLLPAVGVLAAFIRGRGKT